LRSRMRNTPAAGNVHAKTGSLTGVSSLSGYVTAADGRPLVFAMVTNNSVGISVKPIEDAVAVRLASPGAAVAASRVATGPEPDGECSWHKAC
jgi:D-alanyl-D-alanine carboxypeptidase/D-alanyl-D-alanine-endopeptidase (penicillin-binding protein 4)